MKICSSLSCTFLRCLKINCDRCDNAFVVISFKTMYNKTIIRFDFCDIRNNQDLGSASADNTYLDLDYSGYHKNLIQNLVYNLLPCLILAA